MPEYMRIHEKSNLQRWLSQFNPTCKRVGLSAIRNESGEPITDAADAAAELARYWAQVFAAKVINTTAAQELLEESAVTIPTIQWHIDFETFSKKLASTNNSKPGPDGVPYAFWRHAPDTAVRDLYQLYTDILHEATVDDDFNESNFVFLPKGTDAADEMIIARKPGDTRPLSLSNTDAKSVSGALAIPFEELAVKWVSKEQRGFVRGRFMHDNIVDVEAQGVAFTSVKVPQVIMFFLDFAAAFPSVAHEFIFMVLTFIGVPSNVINAVRLLYTNNKHNILFGGSCHKGFTVLAGMKQGCPLSGVLFAIVADILVRALVWRIPPQLGIVRAYADDIAIVLCNAFIVLPALVVLYEKWELASGMILNKRKCVAVPLGWTSLESFSILLREYAGNWADFEVALCAKYLGVYIGPGSTMKSFAAPMKKYEARCRSIRAMGMGLTTTISLYNMFAASVLSFILQFMEPTKQLLTMEREMLQLLTAGPRHAYPPAALFVLKRLGLPAQFEHFECVSIAARTRAVTQTCTTFDDALCKIQIAKQTIDAYFQPPLQQWHKQAMVQQMEDARQQFKALFAVALQDGISASRRKNKGLQAICVGIWHNARVDFDPTPMLAKRVRRFSNIDCESLQVRLQRTIDILRRSVPPSTVAAVLRTWLNGWCTSRRFSQEVLPCRFCSTETDALEHYLVCPAVITGWTTRFGKVFPDTSADAFLMVSDGEPGLHNSQYIARAVFLDCLHYAFQEQKATGKFIISDIDFQRACSTHEQSICERHQAARAALVYAKCGLTRVFARRSSTSTSASAAPAPSRRSTSGAARSTSASSAPAATSFARGSDLVTGAGWSGAG